MATRSKKQPVTKGSVKSASISSSSSSSSSSSTPSSSQADDMEGEEETFEEQDFLSPSAPLELQAATYTDNIDINKINDSNNNNNNNATINNDKDEVTTEINNSDSSSNNNNNDNDNNTSNTNTTINTNNNNNNNEKEAVVTLTALTALMERQEERFAQAMALSHAKRDEEFKVLMVKFMQVKQEADTKTEAKLKSEIPQSSSSSSYTSPVQAALPSSMSTLPAPTNTSYSSPLPAPTLQLQQAVKKEKERQDNIELDEEERKVIKQEKKYIDKVIYEEDNDTSPYESYAVWLLERERRYPFDSDKYKERLYAVRYTLLSPVGRHYEWLRTGFVTRFSPSLYSSQARRFYEYLVQKWTVTNPNNKTIREVKEQSITFPTLSYDSRDIRQKVKVRGDADLMEGSITLSSVVPYGLTVTPHPDELCAIPGPIGFEDYGEKAFKRTIVLRAQTENNINNSAYASTSAVEVASYDESFDCRICGVSVDNNPYSDCCRECDSANKKVKREVPVSSTSTSSSSGTYSTGEEVEQAIRQNKIKKETDSHRELVGDESANEEDKSALGTALTMIHGKDAMVTLRLGKPKVPLSESEKRKTVKTSVALLGKFTGAREKAPQWLSSFVSQVYRNEYDESHCIDILQSCFTGEAKSWLDGCIVRVGVLPRPMEALVISFKDYFMSHIQRSRWKQYLTSTKLSGYSTTITDLKAHYEKFVNTANNLKLCEPNTEESVYVNMFVESLPSSIRGYMGPSYKHCASLDAVMEHAETATTIYNQNKAPTRHGEMPKLESVNSMRTLELDGITYIQVNAAPTTTAQKNNQSATCYHCGAVGHFTGLCRLIDDVQTIKGKAAWVKRCQMKGFDYEYDKRYYVELQNHINNGGAARTFRYNSNNDGGSIRSAVDRSRFNGRGGRGGRGGSRPSSSAASAAAKPASAIAPENVSSGSESE